MEALRDRYARDEISDEEFEQKKKVLQDKKK
ncbi:MULTISPECIES: SHOCT domain-containing protein, partial [Flavobacteriaceae]|jgi:putative membrane protein|uniref:SHOCT domain-containing protein n=5 Tax=Flavobacteriales TaxID=200644 RepID=A0A9X2R8D9_9FLAO